MNEFLEGLTIVKFFLKMSSGLKKRILRGKRLEGSVASLQQEVSNLNEKLTDLQKENTQLKKDVTTQVPSERAEPLGNERLIIGGQASAVKYLCQSLPSSHSLFLLGRDI